VTVHGFRKNFSTWAHEAGFPHYDIEIALGHRVGDEIAEKYDLAQRRKARLLLMEAWADACGRTAPLGAKVIPMRTAKRKGDH
jgi:integrase